MSSDSQSSHRVLGLLVVGLLLVISGCATVTVHSTVTADGTISEYQMQINTSTTVYGFLNEAAKEDGYDSLRDEFLADINQSRAEKVSYDEEIRGDEVTITLTVRDFDPPADASISVTKEDGKMIYEDLTFVNETAETTDQSDISESLTSGIVVTYRLEMPGEITDTNAGEVDGNSAEWRETGMDALEDNRIYAESKVPTVSVGLDGFGILIGLVALLTVGFLFKRIAGNR